jgi:tetratricopeptide (TPR) repeat protein
MPVESIVETEFEETHKNHTAQKDLWDKLKIAGALIGLVSAIYTAELANHYQRVAAKRSAEAADAARRDELKRVAGMMGEKLLPIILRGSAADRDLALQVLKTVSPDLAQAMADISTKYRKNSNPHAIDSPSGNGRDLRRTGNPGAHVISGPSGNAGGLNSNESAKVLVQTAHSFGNLQLYAEADRLFMEAAKNAPLALNANPQKLAQATAYYQAGQFYRAWQVFQEVFAAVGQ